MTTPSFKLPKQWIKQGSQEFKDRADYIVWLREQEYSVQEISTLLQLSVSTIRKALDHLGVKLDGTHFATLRKRKEAAKTPKPVLTSIRYKDNWDRDLTILLLLIKDVKPAKIVRRCNVRRQFVSQFKARAIEAGFKLNCSSKPKRLRSAQDTFLLAIRGMAEGLKVEQIGESLQIKIESIKELEKVFRAHQVSKKIEIEVEDDDKIK